MSDDRLAFVLRAPAIVETVVRTTLRAALEARRAYERPIDARDFANEALAQLDRAMLVDPVRLDAVARHELAAVTVRAAMCFVSSRLARRLFSLDPRRLCAVPRGADAAVRDDSGRLHLIRLESFSSDGSRVAWARRLVRSASDEPAVRLPSVHFFSLRSSRFRSFAPGGATNVDAHGDRHAA